MPDMEKVIKGLEIHSKSMHLNNCNECPYDNCEEEDENGDYEGDCTFCLTNDALALLKEYKRQDGCPCTHCMEWECDEVCEEYKKWKDT